LGIHEVKRSNVGIKERVVAEARKQVARGTLALYAVQEAVGQKLKQQNKRRTRTESTKQTAAQAWAVIPQELQGARRQRVPPNEALDHGMLKKNSSSTFTLRRFRRAGRFSYTGCVSISYRRTLSSMPSNIFPVVHSIKPDFPRRLIGLL
jgi:hypothetical protein